MAKRLFDSIFSIVAIAFFAPAFLFVYIISSIDTNSNGIFTQKRVGQYGKLFTIFKFKTVHPITRKISKTGRLLRKSKLDELPQLFNVLIGDMSFVGPRPDLPGYYDELKGENRKVLDLRPGITSEASIKYRNEEYILSGKENPLQYNDEVIFPDKVKMNLHYFYNRSFFADLKIIIKTFIP